MSDKRKIEDVLRQEGMYVSTTVGVSMFPMLRNRQDTIIVMPYEGRLKKYDVPLYKRGSDYILHRIIEVRPDSYLPTQVEQLWQPLPPEQTSHM